MNKQEIEKAINGLEQLKPLLQAQILMTNYEGIGTEDAKELGEHFDTAIECMEHQLTNGWIPVSERLPEECGYYNVTVNFENLTRTEFCFFDTSDESFYFVADGSETYNQCWREKTDTVIAWQPLPEPYKEAL